MPKLRRLSGKQVIKILGDFGFEVHSQRGSHVKLQRIEGDQEQRIVVAVHSNQPLPSGTLHDIFRQACRYIPEDDLRPYFYTD